MSRDRIHVSQVNVRAIFLVLVRRTAHVIAPIVSGAPIVSTDVEKETAGKSQNAPLTGLVEGFFLEIPI